MVSIFIHFFLFLIICYSNGYLFFRLFLFKNFALNFFEISIVGLIITGFAAQFINFFVPLNDLLIYINLFISSALLLVLRNKKIIYFNKAEISIMAATLILCMSQIYGSGFSDDLTHYHGGQIINADNSKYIIGLNFLHYHYGLGSIWLTLHSYLNFNSTFLQDIHVVNALILFLILSYFITESLKKNYYRKNLYVILGVFILFILIKYTRLKEFGLDRPGTLIFCFLLYIFFKFKENFSSYSNQYTFLISIVCLFLTEIKLFFLFSFLITIFIIIKNRSYNFFLTRQFLFLFFLGFCYIIKNIFITGCLIYPLYFSCIDAIPWSSKEAALWIYNGIEPHTKGLSFYKGSLTQSEFLQSFNWVQTWYTIVSEELLTYIGISISTILLLLASSKIEKSERKNIYNRMLIGFLFFSNLFFFFKMPVIRYHHTLFILFILSFIFLINVSFIKKNTIFNSIVIIFFAVNLSKNLTRIYQNNFINNPIEHLKEIKWYQEPKKKKLSDFIYYNGWIGGYPIGNMSLDKYNHIKLFYDIIYKQNYNFKF
jgi:hypothetical protein